MIDFAIGNLAALLGIAVTMSGLVIAWIKWQLSGDFAKTADIKELGGRVETLERQVGTLPTQGDLRAISDRVAGISDRVGGVEREVGMANVKIDGIRESNARVESSMQMLTKHLLAAED